MPLPLNKRKIGVHRRSDGSTDEIIETVWNGRTVSDGALISRINSTRRAVGCDGGRKAGLPES